MYWFLVNIKYPKAFSLTCSSRIGNLLDKLDNLLIIVYGFGMSREHEKAVRQPRIDVNLCVNTLIFESLCICKTLIPKDIIAAHYNHYMYK